MSVTVTCPSCGSTLRVKDELLGRNIRCAKCSTVIKVDDKPAAREERTAPQPLRPSATPRRRDEGPAERPAAKKSNMGLIVGLVLGVGALLGVCCCGGGAIVYFFVLPQSNPRVTKANFDRLNVGMTMSEVEVVLGPGKTASVSDVKDAFVAASGPNVSTVQGMFEQGVSKGTVYRWKNGSDHLLLILFAASPASGGKSKYFVLFERTGNATSTSMKGSMN